jgi:hypothetical protein
MGVINTKFRIIVIVERAKSLGLERGLYFYW